MYYQVLTIDFWFLGYFFFILAQTLLIAKTLLFSLDTEFSANIGNVIRKFKIYFLPYSGFELPTSVLIDVHSTTGPYCHVNMTL